MAEKFVLTAQLQLQAPRNVRQVVNNIQSQLQNVSVDVEVKNAAKAQKELQQTAKATKDVGKAADDASKDVKKMDMALGNALKQVFRYDVARAIINGFTRTIREGVSDAIKFEREMIKIGQVTNRSTASLKGLEREVSKLATSLGTSSMSLVKVARVLSQTGMSIDDVKISMKSLAQTTLAPTFDDITNTVETAIAAMRQFNINAKDLGRTLSQINSLAANFAVEASDLGVVVRRAGGAFKAAGGQLIELNALFTAVRSTTRETAETIATGFRTIFTRLQRPRTIQFLRQFGVELQDLNGKFIGPYEAVRKLHIALKDLDPRDVRYSQIVEQLGGFRQVSKVIPMIQQFGEAQKALGVAQRAGDSIARDAARAQESLAVRLESVTQKVKELFRKIAGSTAFQAMAKTALSLAEALVKIGDALAPVIPMLTLLAGIKLAQFGFGKFLGGGGGGGSAMGGMKKGGKVTGFARGGPVGGTGNRDTVPAMLQPGEFVMRKSAVQRMGTERLHKMNSYAPGGVIEAKGGQIAGRYQGIQDIFGQSGKRNFGKGRGRRWRRSQDGDEYTDTFNSGTRADHFTGNNTQKFLNLHDKTLQAHAPSVLAIRRAKNDSAKGRAWENLLKNTGQMKPAGAVPGGRFAPLDGTVGGVLGDAAWSTKSHSADYMVAKMFRHRMGHDPNFLSNKETTPDSERFQVGKVSEFIPHPKLKKRIAQFKINKAAGGSISGYGSDTIPAMLTPGEFVVNKKSSQRIGYGNLSRMNKYAKGGRVGMQGGGAMGGMIDPMMLMMMFNPLQGAMGGATDAVKKNTQAQSAFRKGLSQTTKGVGALGQQAVMSYSKYQMLGVGVDMLNQQFLGGSSAITTFIQRLMMTVAALELLTFAANNAAIMDMFKMVGGGFKKLFSKIGSMKIAQKMGMGTGGKLSRFASANKMGVRGGFFGGGVRGAKSIAKDWKRGTSRGAVMSRRATQMSGKAEAMYPAKLVKADAASKARLSKGIKNITKIEKKHAASVKKSQDALKSMEAGQAKNTEKLYANRTAMNKSTAAAKAAGQAEADSAMRLKKLQGIRQPVPAGGQAKDTTDMFKMADKNRGIQDQIKAEKAVGKGHRARGIEARSDVYNRKQTGKALRQRNMALNPKMAAQREVIEQSGKTAKRATKAKGATQFKLAGVGSSGEARTAANLRKSGKAAAQSAAQFGKLAKGAKLAAAGLALSSVATAGLGIAADIAGEKMMVDATKRVTTGATTKELEEGVGGKLGGNEGVRKAAAGGGLKMGGLFASLAGLAAMILGLSNPIGWAVIAIAALVGGIWGWHRAQKKATEAIEVELFTRKMGSLTHALDLAREGLIDPKTAAASVTEGIEGLERRRSTLKDKKGVEGFEKELEKQVPAMTAWIESVAQGAAATDLLAGGPMDDLITKIARLNGEGVEKFRARLIETQKTAETARIAMAKMAAAAELAADRLAETAGVINAFKAMKLVTSATANEISNMGDAVSGFTGQAKLGSVGEMFEDLGASMRLNSGKFENTIDEVASSMGSSGSRLAADMKGSAHLTQSLPGVLSSSVDEIGIGGKPANEVIMEKLEKSSGWSKVPETMRKELQNRLSGMALDTEEGQGLLAKIKADPNAVVEELMKSMSLTKEAFQRASEFIDESNKQIQAAYAARSRLELKTNSELQKLSDMRFAHQGQIREARGQAPATPAQVAAQQARTQNIGLVGTNVAGQGGGTTANMQALGAELKSLQDRINASNATLADANKMTSASWGNLQTSSQGLIDENQKLRTEYQKVEGVLKAHAASTANITAIQKELEKAQRKQAVTLDQFDSYVFATDKGREEWADQMNATRQAVQQGSLEGIDEDKRSGIASQLKEWGDLVVPGGGGKTGTEALGDIRIAEYEKATGQSATADQKTMLRKQATPAQERLIKQLEKAQAVREEAQKQLIENMQKTQQDMTTKIASLQATFLSRLGQLLANAQKARIKEQTDKTTGEAKKAIADYKTIRGTTGKLDIGKSKGNVQSLLKNQGALQKFGQTAGRAEDRTTMFDEMLGKKGKKKHIFGEEQGLLAKKGGMSAKWSAFGGGDANWSKQWGGVEQTGKNKAMTGFHEQYTSKMEEQGFGDFRKRANEIFADATSQNQDVGTVDKRLMALINEYKTQAESEATAEDTTMGKMMGDMGFEGMEAGDKATEGQLARFREKLASMKEEDWDALASVPTKITVAGNAVATSLGELAKSVKEKNEKISGYQKEEKEIDKNVAKSKADAQQMQAKGQTDLAAQKTEQQTKVKLTQYPASGGLIYANTGMFIPRGTDTVPAMLTPGEFVMRKAAVDSIGVDNLRQLNNRGGGRASRFNRGGRVAYHQEGDVVQDSANTHTVYIDVEKFDSAINKFSGVVTNLGSLIGGGIPIEHKHSGTVEVVVHIPAESALKSASAAFGGLIESRIGEAINEYSQTVHDKPYQKTGKSLGKSLEGSGGSPAERAAHAAPRAGAGRN